MKIFAHRGCWGGEKEKNSLEAMLLAAQSGFSIETDIRDCLGNLVISHDPSLGANLKLQTFIKEIHHFGVSLALNIKADGISDLLIEDLKFHDIDYFTFDMSLPETIKYVRKKIPYYSRISDFEPNPLFFEEANGVWLDCFENDWSDILILRSLLDRKNVCVVSPELHLRPHIKVWEMLKSSGLYTSPNLSLCTDFSFEAKDYFV